MFTNDKDCFTEYYEKFNDVFPTYQLGLNEEICSECLKEGKDVYELGYLDNDLDKKY